MEWKFVALSDLFDVTYTLASELESFFGIKKPVNIFTDRKFISDVISKVSQTSEKRMMLEISAAW